MYVSILTILSLALFAIGIALIVGNIIIWFRSLLLIIGKIISKWLYK